MKAVLPREKFVFYIQQDSLYLPEMQQVLLQMSARAKNPRHAEAFRLLHDETNAAIEMVYARYCRLPQSTKRVEPAADTILLIGYLRTLAGGKSFAEAVGGLLACFQIYQEVAAHLCRNARLEGNPYRDWIEAFCSNEFSAGTKAIMAVADEVAEASSEATRREMGKAFFMTARLEWQCWDAAYSIEDRPF